LGFSRLAAICFWGGHVEVPYADSKASAANVRLDTVVVQFLAVFVVVTVV
jgi:hypothetical protein